MVPVCVPMSDSLLCRGWTAEENRHGDALHAYLYLSGRVDMRAVQRTVQRLLAAGMVRHTLQPFFVVILVIRSSIVVIITSSMSWVLVHIAICVDCLQCS